MDDRSRLIAEECLRAAEDNSANFPEIVQRLMQEGFESYAIDFRRGEATYYRPDGESLVLPTHRHAAAVAPAFDVAAIRSAICEAQQLAPEYTYAGFCGKVMAAGCAGYVVSFSGRHAVYLGRTAETHVERFAQ